MYFLFPTIYFLAHKVGGGIKRYDLRFIWLDFSSCYFRYVPTWLYCKHLYLFTSFIFFTVYKTKFVGFVSLNYYIGNKIKCVVAQQPINNAIYCGLLRKLLKCHFYPAFTIQIVWTLRLSSKRKFCTNNIFIKHFKLGSLF